MGFIERWHEEHPEDVELAVLRESEEWTVNIWLSLTHWGLEVSVEREYGGPCWPNARTFIITLGPLAFIARRTWPWRTRPV